MSEDWDAVSQFLLARNLTKGQLFIGVPNVGDSQKAEVYAAPVCLRWVWVRKSSE